MGWLGLLVRARVIRGEWCGLVGVFVMLIGLNVAFHGTLINDFKIPGSDTQKATDLINAKFGGQRGAALRVVVAAPPGQRLDTPERAAAIEKMLNVAGAGQKSIDQHAKDVSQITDPYRRVRISSRRMGGSASTMSSLTRPGLS